jgi:hypothetical protein
MLEVRTLAAAMAALAAAAVVRPMAAPEPTAPATRLVYDLSADELAKLLDSRPDVDLPALVAETIAALNLRNGDAAVATPLGGTRFAVDVRGDPVAVGLVRLTIEHRRRFEMRVVATSDHADNGVSFDLPQEKKRLADWLGKGGRELVLDNPQAIAAFNDDESAGPIAFGHLRWYPHLVRPQPDQTDRWGLPFSLQAAGDRVEPLGDSTVAVFEHADWNRGTVPQNLRQRQGRDPPFLLEYVAVTWTSATSAPRTSTPPASVRASAKTAGCR